MTARVTADKVRITRWLERQGLDQCARAFEEHNIGFDVLPELVDDDLKELGVPLGDRKRLLKAIADLRMSLESAGDTMTSAAARGAADTSRRSRTAAAYAPVLRPGRFDRALRPPRSGGPA
jgi:hypothetical protein